MALWVEAEQDDKPAAEGLHERARISQIRKKKLWEGIKNWLQQMP